ncbi:Type II secretory pathway, pseudopilin PulG [Pasteurellaceae bacterium 15-036681]|nr:Type II secretory pathway, pseudopilin PulG [Pasteurellaceae bacterium 15-036681]
MLIQLKAFSLIETLITLVILILSLYFISPIFFKLHDHLLLNKEIDQVKAFIYQIQSKARYQKQNYSISINQDNQQWCMVAVAKLDSKQIACDCLNINSCLIKDEYRLYHSHNALTLKSNSLYPKVFMNVDGNAGRLESKCLGFALNNEKDVIQFEQNGVVYVIQKNKRSTCR